MPLVDAHSGDNTFPNENDNGMTDSLGPMSSMDNNMHNNYHDDVVVAKAELFTYTKHQHIAAKLLKLIESWKEVNNDTFKDEHFLRQRHCTKGDGIDDMRWYT